MNFRKERAAGEAEVNSAPGSGRDEIRELAEAIGLYRSAMHHVASRATERPWVEAATGSSRTRRMRLVLVPAMAAALTTMVAAPVYSHFHEGKSAAAAAVTQGESSTNAETRAAVDDTALMNQIYSEVSEEVPDALQPLADMSEMTTTKKTATERNSNVTQH